MLFAVKQISKAHIKKQNQETNIKNELIALKLIGENDRVVHYQCSISDNNQLYQVFEFVTGFDTECILENPSLTDLTTTKEFTLWVAKNTLQILWMFNSYSLIHRDIKPGNIMINKEGEL